MFEGVTDFPRKFVAQTLASLMVSKFSISIILPEIPRFARINQITKRMLNIEVVRPRR
jgi:hypothetical protein